MVHNLIILDTSVFFSERVRSHKPRRIRCRDICVANSVLHCWWNYLSIVCDSHAWSWAWFIWLCWNLQPFCISGRGGCGLSITDNILCPLSTSTSYKHISIVKMYKTKLQVVDYKQKMGAVWRKFMIIIFSPWSEFLTCFSLLIYGYRRTLIVTNPSKHKTFV